MRPPPRIEERLLSLHIDIFEVFENEMVCVQ